MKATEQYIPMILFITLYKVALTFESVDEILSVPIQMEVTKQYFLRHCLFRCTYTLWLDSFPVQGCSYFSNESNWAMLSRGAVYYSVQRLFQLLSLWTKSFSLTIQRNLPSSTFPWYCLLRCIEGGPNYWLCGWNPPFTIQFKATEQYFPVVLFITLNKNSWSLTSTFQWYYLLHFIRWFKLLSLRMKSSNKTNQLKATEQYFP